MRDSRVKAQQIGEELGAHYLLEGSVHRSSDRLRVTANLIDAATGRHLWAEKYDRRWQDVFALQDDITQHILANISSFEGPLEEASRGRAKRKPPSESRLTTTYRPRTFLSGHQRTERGGPEAIGGRRVARPELQPWTRMARVDA